MHDWEPEAVYTVSTRPPKRPKYSTGVKCDTAIFGITLVPVFSVYGAIAAIVLHRLIRMAIVNYQILNIKNIRW